MPTHLERFQNGRRIEGAYRLPTSLPRTISMAQFCFVSPIALLYRLRNMRSVRPQLKSIAILESHISRDDGAVNPRPSFRVEILQREPAAGRLNFGMSAGDSGSPNSPTSARSSSPRAEIRDAIKYDRPSCLPFSTVTQTRPKICSTSARQSPQTCSQNHHPQALAQIITIAQAVAEHLKKKTRRQTRRSRPQATQSEAFASIDTPGPGSVQFPSQGCSTRQPGQSVLPEIRQAPRSPIKSPIAPPKAPARLPTMPIAPS